MMAIDIHDSKLQSGAVTHTSQWFLLQFQKVPFYIGWYRLHHAQNVVQFYPSIFSGTRRLSQETDRNVLEKCFQTLEI